LASSQRIAPFGEMYDNIGSTVNLNFTGDNRTMASAGLYDTINRELHPNEGRWISPDPAGAGAVNMTNPQSWNRYAYVGNNPLSFTDPSGLCANCGPGTPSGFPGYPGAVPYFTVPLLCDMGTICFTADGLIGDFGDLLQLAGADSTAQPVVTVTPPPLDSVQTDVVGDLSNPLETTVATPSQISMDGPGVTITYPGYDSNVLLLAQGPGGQGPANNASPDPTLDNRANALAQALRKTGVQTLNSPCTIGGFYLGSAALGAGGAAVANAPEIVAVASENYPTWFNRFVSWLAGKASNPGPVGATGAALGAAYEAGKQFCGSF
jgi:RHS repeat-associated protein